MTNRSYDVVVVGAGILGSTTAYYLKKNGVPKVLIVERGDIASGGTGKSAAIVRSYFEPQSTACSFGLVYAGSCEKAT